jgi:hypothetical protein
MSLALSMTQNKTGVFFLSVYQSDGVTPQSLVGSTLWFHAAFPGQGFTLTKSSPSSGITITNTAGGLNCATLQIEPADTAALIISLGNVIGMDCELTLQNASEEYELNSGVLTVAANVGTP